MTEKPEVKIRVSPEGIPSELKNLPRWVLWRHTWNRRTKRWGKVPYRPSGDMAASNDPNTWCSFEEALAKVGGYDGLGFVFNGDGITGIDLDDVVDDTGIWTDEAELILKAIPGYAELSPSGTGLHIITRAEHIGKGKSKDGVEAYSTERYFTFTGNQLNGHTSVPEDVQDIKPFLNWAFGDKSTTPVVAASDLDDVPSKPPRGRSVEQMREVLSFIYPPDDEPECTPYIWAAHHESGGAPEVLALCHEWLAGELHDDPQPKYEPGYVDDRWARSKDGKPNAKTWRSVEFEAKKNGWKGEIKAEPTDSDKAFRFYPGDDYATDFNAAPEIVEDVLPDRGIVMVFGPSGKGKTFWTLDLAFHVHNGVKWRDKDVVGGDVMYVAAEAGRGIKKRIHAVKRLHPEWRAPFVADIAPDLASAVSLEAVRDAALAVGKPSIVIIDTMSASFEGDDSSQQDVAKMMRNLKTLSDALECLVIFVHHTTKDGGSYRGSGVLFANVDAVLELISEGEGAERKQWVTQKKHREGEDGKSYPFNLVISEPLAHKPNGKPITSCTIEHIEHEGGRTIARKEKKSTGGAFETSDNYATARHFLSVIQDELGMGDANMDETDVIAAIQKDEKDNKSGFDDYPPVSNIKRTLLTLARLGKIRKEGRWIRLC
jgi:KaiC/GvpD/RAD55 family RecA-like ATPase